jgi:hypothetical protein
MKWVTGIPMPIERQLAHQEANAVRRPYLHSTDYWAECVQMMQAWSNISIDWVTFSRKVAK